jgi:hypothetical protein
LAIKEEKEVGDVANDVRFMARLLWRNAAFWNAESPRLALPAGRLLMDYSLLGPRASRTLVQRRRRTDTASRWARKLSHGPRNEESPRTRTSPLVPCYLAMFTPVVFSTITRHHIVCIVRGTW